MKKAAFVYDYDGTLAKGNIQETTFLPELGIETGDFWGKVKKKTVDEDADEILVYMQLMLEEARLAKRKSQKSFYIHMVRNPLFSRSFMTAVSLKGPTHLRHVSELSWSTS